MKPLYLVLIGAVVLIVIFLIYRSNQNKQAANTAATLSALQLQNQGALAPGGSSGVAQIISSLFPFFNSAASNGLIGDGKGGTTKKDTQVTPDYLPPKVITFP